MKPERVITASKCSVCGLPWDDAHEANPSEATCIAALKKALAGATRSKLGYMGTPMTGGVTLGTTR